MNRATAPGAADGGAAARDAIAAGCAALAERDRRAAVRWFERATRLAPNESAARHLLACALAGLDDARALAILEDLLAASPFDRDAHTARLAALHRLSDARAAAALDAILSQFSIPTGPAFAALATQVARTIPCAGWVGATGAGRAVVCGNGISLSLDASKPFRAPGGPAWCDMPQRWRGAGTLRAASGEGRVLGGTIDLAGQRHTEGFVAFDADRGLHGWAVSPRDPDTIPLIGLFAGSARRPFDMLAAGDGTFVPARGSLVPRGFSLPAAQLPHARAWHVRTRYGAELAGSPIRIGDEARAASGAARNRRDAWRPLPVSLAGVQPPGSRATPQRRAIDIVIPVYRGAAQAKACFESAVASLPPGGRVVVVDDASPEPALRAWVQAEAASGRLVLLRHARNRGFPAAANTGLRHAGGRDVVLLNSDAVLPPGAIARLADAAYAAPDCGTVTPMTAHGVTAIAAVPDNAVRDAQYVGAIDADLQAANGGLRINLPTCAGFCVFIRHDCLAETGLLREDAFAQGYGEENDFSRRAAQLGWRHVAACDVFVAHEGGASFSAAGPSLLARNQAVLERLHPGYAELVAGFAARDPLAPARTAFAARRWAAGRRDSAVVLVTHNSGGGVERHVTGRVAEIRATGARAIVVRPVGGLSVCDGVDKNQMDLTFASVSALADFLRADNPRAVELHHTAAHTADIARLAGLLRVPFDIFVHDYAALCPRVTLRAEAWYCGEPDDARDCDDCIADHGARMNFTGKVSELRARQAAVFAAARRVVVPAPGVARRLRRYMPGLHASVRPWEDDALLPAAPLPRLDDDGEVHVALTGAIGADKGFDILLTCARDAARRGLRLRFTVIGGTMDDGRLLDTGRVFVTGPFAEGEAGALLRDAAPHIGLLPSVWPETWCYALTALWQTGLHVLAFDLGAPAERIRARGAGTLLPPGATARAVNDTLLDLARAPSRGMARRLTAHG